MNNSSPYNESPFFKEMRRKYDEQVEKNRIERLRKQTELAKEYIPHIKIGKRSPCRCRERRLEMQIGEVNYCGTCGRMISKKKKPHYVRPWSCAIDGHQYGMWISRKCYCLKCKQMIERRHPIMTKTPAGKLKA